MEERQDLISRQAAIDATQRIGRLATLPDNDAVIRMNAVEYVLFNLPSVQPEIIRCKECKYWFDIDDGRQKHRMCADVYGDWYCADAKRRTDG